MIGAPCCCVLQGGNVSFTHVFGAWSACTQPCDLHGAVQTRSVVACTLLGDGWMLDVDWSYCDDNEVTWRQSPPITERDCDVCPRWEIDEWRQVNFSNFYFALR